MEPSTASGLTPRRRISPLLCFPLATKTPHPGPLRPSYVRQQVVAYHYRILGRAFMSARAENRKSREGFPISLALTLRHYQAPQYMGRHRAASPSGPSSSGPSPSQQGPVPVSTWLNASFIRLYVKPSPASPTTTWSGFRLSGRRPLL